MTKTYRKMHDRGYFQLYEIEGTNLIEKRRVEANEARIATLMGEHGLGPRVEEYDEVDETLTMEKIEGESLWHYLKSGKGEWRNIQPQVLSLVKHMHNIGVVHLDLHLENIMVGQDQDLYIIDFESSKYYPIGEDIPDRHMKNDFSDISRDWKDIQQRYSW